MLDDPIVAPDEESRRDDGIRGMVSTQNSEFHRNDLKNVHGLHEFPRIKYLFFSLRRRVVA